MKSGIKKALLDSFENILTIIENDKDYLGNFFKEGQIEINIERIFDNNVGIKCSDQYNFILQKSSKDNVSLEIESGTKTFTTYPNTDLDDDLITAERELDIDHLLTMEN